MKLLTALFCTLLCFQLNAQNFEELNKEFVDLFRKGEFEKAIPIGEKAVVQARKEFGERHENYAIANYNLAEAYQALKNADKALLSYKEAIKTYSLFEETYGLDLALCHNSAGIIFFIKNQYDSAAFHYEKSFSFLLRALKRIMITF